MIVVAIIGILAAIAVPKFADMIRQSKEGATKGNLGSIRSAFSVYYANTEGQLPASLAAMTINGGYMSVLPVSVVPYYHDDSSIENAVCPGILFGPPDLAIWGCGGDLGGWAYNSSADIIAVNCTHTDSKGREWSLF